MKDNGVCNGMELVIYLKSFEVFVLLSLYLY